MGKVPQITHFGSKTDGPLKILKDQHEKGSVNELWTGALSPGLNAHQRLALVEIVGRCKDTVRLEESPEFFSQVNEVFRPKDRPERSEFAFRPEFFPGNNAANAWATSRDGNLLAYLTQTDVAIDWTDRPASELEVLVGTKRGRMAINFFCSDPRELKTIFLKAPEGSTEDFKGPSRILAVDQRWVILECQSTKGSRVWCIPLYGDQEPKLSPPEEVPSPILGYSAPNRNVAYEVSTGQWCLRTMIDGTEVTVGSDSTLPTSQIPTISKIVFDSTGNTGVLIPRTEYLGPALLGILELDQPNVRWIRREQMPGLSRVSDGCFLPDGLVRRRTLFVVDDQGRPHSLTIQEAGAKHLRWPETQAPLRDCSTVISVGSRSGWLAVLFSSRKVIRFFNYEHTATLMDLKIPNNIDSMAWAFGDRVLITRSVSRGPRQYLQATLVDYLTLCGKDTTTLGETDLAKITALLTLVPHHPQLEAIKILVDHWQKEASRGR